MKFRTYSQDQIMLLPPNVQEMIPKNHLVRVIDTVVEQLDLRKLYNSYSEEGQPGYHPKMLLKLLLYGYSTGIRSSRKMAQKTESDIYYMYLSGMQRPDFRTISDFRKLKIEYIRECFVEVVLLCKKLGMIKFGHISIDGSKIKANASKQQNYNNEDIAQLEKRIEEEMKEILSRAEKTDTEEDKQYGKERSGDEIPEELTDKQKFLEKLKKAKKEIEEEKLKRINLTDKDSRLMLNSDGGYNMNYNAQIAVDSKSQIIVSCDVVSKENDYHEFIPIYEQSVKNTGLVPDEVSADAGYSSGETYNYVRDNGIDAYIPDGKLNKELNKKTYEEKISTYDRRNFKYKETKNVYSCPEGKNLEFKRNNKRNGVKFKVYEGTECLKCNSRRLCISNSEAKNRQIQIYENDKMKFEMRNKLKSKEGMSKYLTRLSIIEPVFAHIKGVMGFRQFLLRGIEKVKAEFSLICMAHNIKKIKLAI
jgi:transposase